MSQSLNLNEPSLPQDWLIGRSACVPDVKGFHPCVEPPSTKTLLSWFEAGVARALRFGPVPSVGKQEYFCFQFEVLCFTTNAEMDWRSCSSQPFLCDSDATAKQYIKQAELTPYT